MVLTVLGEFLSLEDEKGHCCSSKDKQNYIHPHLDKKKLFPRCSILFQPSDLALHFFMISLQTRSTGHRSWWCLFGLPHILSRRIRSEYGDYEQLKVT